MVFEPAYIGLIGAARQWNKPAETMIDDKEKTPDPFSRSFGESSLISCFTERMTTNEGFRKQTKHLA
jgi:hypothetical protein